MIKSFSRVMVLIAVMVVLSGSRDRAVEAQANHCGNGLTWQFEVGDIGWVDPTPPATPVRLRDAPNGAQVGAVEPGEMFLITDGPECDSNGLTWWEIVGADSESVLFEKNGWIAEGVDEYFIMQALTVVENQTPECTEGTPSRLEVGQLARITDVENITLYFGHPLIEGGLFVLPDGGSLTLSEDASLLMVEGPYCFDGSSFWRVDDRGINFESVGGFFLDLPFAWVRENIGETYLLEPAGEVESTLAYDVPVQTLTLDPVLVDPLAQLAFPPGAGGGGATPVGVTMWSFDFGWPCGDLGERQAVHELPVLIPFGFIVDAEECLTLYPFDPGAVVDITIRQPDGTVFSQTTQEAQTLKIRNRKYHVSPQTDSAVGVQAEVGAVAVDLPLWPGLATGVWTVEASDGLTTIRKTYQFKRNPYRGIMSICDGYSPAIFLSGFAANEELELVLVEFGELDESGGDVYKERGRWSLQMGPHGDFLAYPEFIIPRSVYVIAGADGTWTTGGDRPQLNPDNERAMRGCSAPMTAAEAREAPLNYGDFATHFLAFDEDSPERYYAFEGAAGDVVTLDLIASDDGLDLMLQLLDPAGTVIAENDDAADPLYNPLDAQIAGFTLPDDGLYTIVARAVDGIGTYALTLHAGQSNTIATPISAAGAGASPNTIAADLNYGDFIEGAVTTAEGETVTFNASAGDVISIVLDSDEFDTHLELTDAAGSIIAEDDDGGNGTNSLLKEIALPASGPYTIIARGVGGKGGAFSLSLKLVSLVRL